MKKIIKMFSKNRNQPVFEFNHIFKIRQFYWLHPSINYKKATIKNICRSFMVSKFRWVKHLLIIKKQKKQFLSNIKSKEDLAALTSLTRPGPMDSYTYHR